MTTKYLTGSYPGGYTLSSTYNGLVIEASASIGGSGLSVNTLATVDNLGTVNATSGAAAVSLNAGGVVTNGAPTDWSAETQGVVLAGAAVGAGQSRVHRHSTSGC